MHFRSEKVYIFLPRTHIFSILVSPKLPATMTVVTLAPDTMVDSTIDFGAPPTANGTSKRTLLVAPPSIAAHEERLRELFTTFDRGASDLQMLDRLSAGLVALSAATYDLVMVLTDVSGAPRPEISRELYALLVPSMKAGAKLQFEKGSASATENREAILAGLVEMGDSFEKVEEEEVVIPLRFGSKKNNGVQKTVILDLNDDDDDLIDENELLSAEDLKRPIQIRESSPILSCFPPSLTPCSTRMSAQAWPETAACLQGLHLRSSTTNRSRGTGEAGESYEWPQRSQARDG